MSEFEPEPFGSAKGLVAVLDTSVLVLAWLSPPVRMNASGAVMLLAGAAYDSFTSPAVLEELEEVLTRPRFGANLAQVRRWVDVFVRASRQVFPEVIPGEDASVVRGDLGDLPILKTAYATAASQDLAVILAAAQRDAGWFLVSENRRHFTPGWNVHGWQFISAHNLLQILRRRTR